MKTNFWKQSIHWFCVLIIIAAFSFPFVWMLLSSMKNQLQITSGKLFDLTWSLSNYRDVFMQYNFLHFIVNSLIVAFGSTLGSLVLGLPAAYAIARYKMQGLGLVILAARIVPGISFVIPWFILFTQMKLIGTYTALILSHMLVGLPFVTWIMISFIETIPSELEEAAVVDGCSQAGAFTRIVLPLSGPGIMTSSILSFIFSWNNFMFSLVLAGDRTKTLPLAIFNFMSYSEINWGGLMAAACIITVPVLVIALFVQRYIVSGMAAGALKG